MSDTSDHRFKCEGIGSKSKGICIKCDETGCNNMAKVNPPSLSCISCKKSVECAFGQDNKEATACEAGVPFGEQESCYIHYSLGELNYFLHLL